MKYSVILQELKDFTLIINKKLIVTAVSANITSSDITNDFIGLPVVDVFSNKYVFDTIESNDNNLNFLDCEIETFMEEVFTHHSMQRHILKKIAVRNTVFRYSFDVNATRIDGDSSFVTLEIKHFKKCNVNANFYDDYFDSYDDEFQLIKKLRKVGKFIVDLEESKYQVYGNDVIPEFLNIEKNIDNLYVLNNYQSNTKDVYEILRSDSFFSKFDKLINGEIKILHDEWLVGEKWLKLEAKVLQKDIKGSAKIIGGVVSDITDHHKYRDLEILHSIYELAINSSGIGIFYYNLDKHSNRIFEANQVYGDMLGIDPVYDDFYSVEDFLNAQLLLEDEISQYDDVKVHLSRLFKGEVYEATDDILKIKNAKTNEIRYLLSSFKIYSFYEDGKPKRFGGIIIDVTERILTEQKQRAYAYKDELTQLGNNRLLHKDMLEKQDGIGLFFDLDDFKKMNDTYGHIFGDNMIQLFAKCLVNAASSYEFVTVYRLYGDEFFVFAEFKNEDFAYEFEEKSKDYIALEMKDIKEDVSLVASMGCAHFEAGASIDDFIKSADYSMYKTKIKKKE